MCWMLFSRAPRARSLAALETVSHSAKSAAATSCRGAPGPPTGAKLLLQAEGDSLPSGVVQILVGRSTGTSKYDPIIPSGLTPRREEEGYAIVKEGDILVLAGNDADPYHGTE